MTGNYSDIFFLCLCLCLCLSIILICFSVYAQNDTLSLDDPISGF